MRSLTIGEYDDVVGGDPISDLYTAARTGVTIGTLIVQNLPVEIVDTIGGTIDAVLVNVGIADIPHDVPVADENDK